MERFQQRVAVVTGASSGIGRAIAVKLAEEGASVVLGDIRATPKEGKHSELEDTSPTHEFIGERDGEATFVETDIADSQQCKNLVETAFEEYGKLDILVNNAGINISGNIEEISIEDWHTVLDINLSGQFYCAKYAIPELKRTEGTVINISSVQGIDGGAGPPYAASKAAILNFTRDLATEYGGDNVTVNAICPGAVRTPNWNYLSEEEVKQARDRNLLPRYGEPKDIADAAAFLASDEAEWITGEALYVDGGWSAHRG